MSKPPISRAALIRAGAPFKVENFKMSSRYNNYEQREKGPTFDHDERLQDMEGKDVVVWMNPTWDVASVQPLDDPYAPRADVELHGRGYEQLISLLEECDPEAVQVLREELPQPLTPQGRARAKMERYPQLHAVAARGEGLEPDALLYAAAWSRDRSAVEHYLAMGADPLRPTYDGECAARIGVIGRMFEEFADHLDARNLRTGRTGLHDLDGAQGQLRNAIKLGADMYWADYEGNTVASTVSDPHLRTSLLTFQAEHRAEHLEKTLPAAEEWCPSADDGRRLAERLGYSGDDQGQPQPSLQRKPGWRL